MNRRRAIGEYPGLRLAFGLLLSLGLLGLFVLIAVNIGEPGDGGHIDNWLGRELEEVRIAHPMLTAVFIGITYLGSFYVIAPLTILVALLLMSKRRVFLGVLWLLAQSVGGLFNSLSKIAFDRARPDFRDASVYETTASFPSGHAMGSIICYGMLVYLLLLFLPGKSTRIMMPLAMALLILAIGFSRIYLGAHFFTDVLGGFAVGGCWLTVCICAAEAVRRHSSREL